MDRNIKIAYALSFLKNSWFWLGIWVFYYLKFTNYAGIGIIETTLVLTMVLAEIPTGAIADLLGKRITLIISFLLQAVCNLMMGFAFTLPHLIIAVFLGGLGGTLYSGAAEALVYDSLKQEHKESLYDKVISNMSTLSLVAMTVSSIVGGFIYTLNPGLPFIAVGVAYLLAMFLSFFLKEPKIDSEKFSLKSFIYQSRQGINQLFSNVNLKNQTLLLLSVGAFLVISDEMLDSVLGVEFGFNSQQLGILMSIVFLVSAFASQFTPLIIKKVGHFKGVIIVGLLLGFSYIVSPVVGLFLGGITLIFRTSLMNLYSNLTSVIINKNTESKYRATTLSTYNMIKNIPYALSAYFLGSLMDTITARSFALIIGSIIISLLLIQSFRTAKTPRII